jgi:hypothetical protein
MPYILLYPEMIEFREVTVYEDQEKLNCWDKEEEVST